MNLISRDVCYGCGACMVCCPVRAISMESDEEGFLYPVITNDLCIECSRCVSVCPKEGVVLRQYGDQVYCAKHLDNNIRTASTSGGAFSALAEKVLDMEGAVYGAAFVEFPAICHKRVDTKEELAELRGTKYVQSPAFEVFSSVELDLLSNRKVLFVGTPCQVQGVVNALKSKKCPLDNLYTCELICNSVPSPLVWRNHVLYLEESAGKRLVNYEFRSKIDGWHGHVERAYYEDGTSEYRSKRVHNFADLFHAGLIARPCCSRCDFAGSPSVADFTIGDCWGIDLVNPMFDDNLGCSMVIPNNEKAQRFWGEVSAGLEFCDFGQEPLRKHNHFSPTPHSISREAFWDAYWKHGYAYAVKKFAGDNLVGCTAYHAKKYLRKLLVKVGMKRP